MCIFLCVYFFNVRYLIFGSWCCCIDWCYIVKFCNKWWDQNWYGKIEGVMNLIVVTYFGTVKDNFLNIIAACSMTYFFIPSLLGFEIFPSCFFWSFYVFIVSDRRNHKSTVWRLVLRYIW